MIANLKKNKKKGFTMVELIVVIAIIAIIAAVAVPTTISYVQKARTNTALSETSSVLNTIETYFTDFAATGDGSIEATDLVTELDEMMPNVQHTTGITVVNNEDNTFTITVSSSQEGGASTKTYNADTYGFTIADCTLTAPSGEAGWTAAS